MARAIMELSIEEFEQLADAMKAYEGDTEKRINTVLHEEAGQLISDEIQRLLPSSGRTWKGKKRAATEVQPFAQANDNLSVTVKTRNSYHYLYFPDDGGNTKSHAGNQHFMQQGADNKTKDIIDRCIASLTEDF